MNHSGGQKKGQAMQVEIIVEKEGLSLSITLQEEQG
jgi:hypothetical protein